MNDFISRTREEILREAEEKAYANEKSFHGCSQSTLAALQDVFDCRNDSVFQAASGLGGGVGLTAETGLRRVNGRLYVYQPALRKKTGSGRQLRG